jgi:hypothetical protein
MGDETQAVTLSIFISKSFASLRHRPSQAKGALRPATWQIEAFCLVGSLDDFELPCANPAQRAPKLCPSVATIGKDAPQPGIE